MMKNKRTILSLAILFFVGALLFAGGPKRRAILNKTRARMSYADGEVLVKFKPGFDLAAVNNFAAAQSLKMKKHFKFLSRSKGQEIVLLKSADDVDARILAKTLSENANVVYASPNYQRFLAATPNDTYFSSLWGMHNTGQDGGTDDADIDAPEAWDISTGSASVIVAVIDTGFDYTHPDLAANAWTNPGEIAGNNRDDDGNGYIDDVYGIDPAGWNGLTPDCNPMDGYGHGTHCAGSIGARGNNGLGVVGVNWNVKIMGLKFMDEYGGSGYDAFSIECIEYVVWEKQYHGQNVVAINASWGGYEAAGAAEPIDALRDAIEMANDAGIVFCAAAGNDANNNDATGGYHHYPSDYTLPGIISVAATDHNDALASFSNYGAASIDLGAPGASIMSTVPAYVPQSGDIFFDNVESGSGGWTHAAISGTDHWAITTNQEGFVNPTFPVPSPPNFWSDYPGSNYPNNSNTYLAYNSNINLSGYVGQKIFLGFGAAWYILISDHGYLEFSSNGGASWTIINDFTDAGYYWSNYSFVIPDSFKTNQFRMRFRLTSNNSGNQYGWLIDNVGIGFANIFYEAWDGTSMATPHVAGAVALMASVFPNETVSQRKKRILDNGDSKASLAGRTVTGRRLNLYNSITAAAPTTDPSITVTSPNGGEVWVRNTAYNVTWTSTGTVGNVDLHYSTNSGLNWTLIAGNTANDGIQAWTTPNVSSTTCLVRVQETDGTPSDMSNAFFSLVRTAGAETVSTPDTPNGPATGSIGAYLTYVTGGSVTSQGHPVQYYFDWGDGTNSGWLATGTTMAAHSWAAASTYNVTARARCATHTTIVSAYSTAFVVRLYNEPTWAGISRFAACAESGAPTVEWHTAGEAGAVGFNLWRRDRETREYVPVNSGLLPALTNSPQGGIYRCADPGAFPGEPVVYRLEEIDAQGRSINYGPYTITFGDPDRLESLDRGVGPGKEEANDIFGYQRFERGRSPLEQERLDMRRRERPSGAALAAAAVKERAKITVKGRGLFYVTAAQIASSLGLAPATVGQLISGHNLSLTSMGKYASWMADGNGAGLFFYNDGGGTVYSDRNVFFLERGSGLAMEEEGGGNAGPADPGQTFRDALHFEENRIALMIESMNPAGDLWFWDYVVAGAAAKSFPIEVPGGAAAGRAALKVSLQGATETAAENDHHAVVSLNGTRIGETAWNGTSAREFSVEFDASLLRDGANSVTVSGVLDTGAEYSTFYVESFDLSYPRYYRAAGNILLCRGDGNSVVTVSGITEAQAVVLDVSFPTRPKLLRGAAPDVSGRVTFVPRAAEKTYLVSGLNAALRPLAVVGDRPAQLKGDGHSAEYMVIAPEEFKETAQRLADHRQARGLKAMVVTLEDIYDAFNYGVPSPLAVRSFLTQAYKSKAPRNKAKYAVLAGKGTYDYNDYQGQGDNLMPVILGKTPNGLCAADKMFGDVVGKDGVPEIAVGRLPAVTNAELGAMIDKIKAYESEQGSWTARALFIADNADGGGDFAQSCNELAALAPGFTAEKIYLNGDAVEARNRIGVAWNAGAALAAYCGHAGINQLAAENLLDVAVASTLGNGGRLPLAAMFTCTAGRFEIPGFTSLGEALLLNGEGGAVAGLFPAGAGMNADSLRLGEEFFRALFRGDATCGAALVAAMKNHLQQGGAAYVLNLYNWIGDPALKAK